MKSRLEVIFHHYHNCEKGGYVSPWGAEIGQEAAGSQPPQSTPTVTWFCCDMAERHFNQAVVMGKVNPSNRDARPLSDIVTL